MRWMIFIFNLDKLKVYYAMKKLNPEQHSFKYSVIDEVSSKTFSTFYMSVFLIILSYSGIAYKLLFHCISSRYVTAYVNATNVFTKSFVNLYVCAVGVGQSEKEGVTAVRKSTAYLKELFVKLFKFQPSKRSRKIDTV